MFSIFQTAPPKYIDQSLPKIDQTRQKNLHEIQQALNKYYDANHQQYPLFNLIQIDGKTDLLTQELAPLFINPMPKDPNSPAVDYRYSSLSGKSFLLTATLSDGRLYELTDEGSK
jgi:hypothetical protein